MSLLPSTVPRMLARQLCAQCRHSSSMSSRMAFATTRPSISNSSVARHASIRPASSYTSQQQAHYSRRNRSLLLYTSAVLVLGVGVTYAAVPLYRIFCSATGYGGTPITSGNSTAVIGPDGKEYGLGRFAAEKLIPYFGDPLKGERERKIRVTFNADCSDALPWKFTPLQKSVTVRPGESALAFYTATNKSDKDIIGIATYNVTPNNVAPYFAKVECFCFEEQRLLAGEEVDLPILFFIDRDFTEEAALRDVDDVVLSYTFFRAKRDSYGNLVPDNSPV